MKVLHLVDGTEAGLNAFAYDCSKVIISTEKSSINGPELGRILREDYHMEAEMEAEQYVTAIMTVADTQEGFERVERAWWKLIRIWLDSREMQIAIFKKPRRKTVIGMP